MKPKIGIPLPTSRDLAYNRACWPEYAAAVQASGGEAVQIPLDFSARRQLAAQCAGFVLPGSPADVSPARYGQAAAPETAAADPEREECDFYLLEAAAESGKPLLGICFGLQSANVWRGGTLVQDLQPVPVNHSAGSQVAAAHGVIVLGQSLLASLLSEAEAPSEGQFRRLTVNSSHHQAVAVPGEDLVVVARSAEDGVIEAVEGAIGRSQLIAVQWHPERSVTISAASRALFSWLVLAALDWSEQVEGASLADTL